MRCSVAWREHMTQTARQAGSGPAVSGLAIELARLRFMRKFRAERGSIWVDARMFKVAAACALDAGSRHSLRRAIDKRVCRRLVL